MFYAPLTAIVTKETTGYELVTTAPAWVVGFTAINNQRHGNVHAFILMDSLVFPAPYKLVVYVKGKRGETIVLPTPLYFKNCIAAWSSTADFIIVDYIMDAPDYDKRNQ